MENPVSKHVDPGQMPHSVAIDLGLHCLPMTLTGFQEKVGYTLTWLYLLTISLSHS